LSPYFQGGDMASELGSTELGGPVVKMRAADLVFAAVFVAAAAVVLVAALLLV
jgi:hypothetical protein